MTIAVLCRRPNLKRALILNCDEKEKYVENFRVTSCAACDPAKVHWRCLIYLTDHRLVHLRGLTSSPEPSKHSALAVFNAVRYLHFQPLHHLSKFTMHPLMVYSTSLLLERKKLWFLNRKSVKYCRKHATVMKQSTKSDLSVGVHQTRYPFRDIYHDHESCITKHLKLPTNCLKSKHRVKRRKRKKRILVCARRDLFAIILGFFPCNREAGKLFIYWD